MSNWKVSKEKIELFEHPNAEKLQIGKVGTYQVVVQKGLYEDGDTVVFAPEKSILSGKLKEEFQAYLSGSNKDRVKEVRLRGEVSAGIIIPIQFWDQTIIDAEFGADLSELFGITKYEPPIPEELLGKVSIFDMPNIGHHDCEQYRIYINQFIEGEEIIATEKVCGSQLIVAYNFEIDQKLVSSKGLLKDGLSFIEEVDNVYWEATRNNSIFEKIKDNFSSGTIQLFGELIPAEKGYPYGQTEKVIRIFDIRIDGVSIPYNKIPDAFLSLWVPIVYIGPYENINDLLKMCEGQELVSGQTKHIREGIVVRPLIDRMAKDGTKLRLKIINPAYAKKITGEEIN